MGKEHKKGTREIHNLHITGYELLPPPDDLKKEFHLEGEALKTVREGHRSVKGILDREDQRLIVVVGPCSIHNPEEALEYARLLKPLADELADDLLRRKRRRSWRGRCSASRRRRPSAQCDL